MPEPRFSFNGQDASELHDSAFLQKIADHSPNLLYVIDLQEQKIIYVNSKVEEFLGFGTQHVYEQKSAIFKKVVHPDDYQRRLENINKCGMLQDGEETEVEVRFQTRVGWQWVRIKDKVFEREEDGTVSKVIGTAHNIHQQKLGEEKLREEHRRFQDAQAIGHIGSFIRKLPGDLLIGSDEFYRIHGLKPRSEGTNLEEFASQVHPDDRETLLAAVKHTHATGSPLDLISRIVRPDGSVRHLHRRSAIIKNEEGVHTHVYGTIQDITERVKAEEERKRLNDLMRSVFDASPDSIVLYDIVRNESGRAIDFTFRMLNAHNLEIFGVTDDILGRRFSEVFPQVFEYGVLEKFIETAETGKPADFETLYDGAGLQHWFHFRVSRVNEYLVVTTEDITERKKAEQELVRLKDELAQRVTESEDRFLALVAASSDTIYKMSADWKHMYNLKGENFFAETTRVSNSWLQQYIPKHHRKMVLEKIKESIRSKSTCELEHQVIDAAGNIGWTYSRAIPTLNDQGEIVEWLGVASNITKRKQAEERQSFFLRLNDTFRSLTDPAEIKLRAMHLLGEHLVVARAYFSRILPDSDTLLTGPGYFRHSSLLPGEVKIAAFGAGAGKLLRAGKSLVINDFRDNAAQNGEADPLKRADVAASILVPLVRNGYLLEVVNVHQSIPRQWTVEDIQLIEEVCERTWTAVERAATEKALRESEQRFRNLVESSALAVWEANAEGHIVRDSLSWRTFTGQTFEQYRGTGWANAVHPDDKPFATKQWREAVASGRKVDVEFRIEQAEGGYRWTNTKAIPIYDIEGNITKWSGMNLDIHDRKLAEEQLLKAKNEAEAASRAKEDFVSTISHEMRTPLNAVIGLTNLLLEQKPREDQKRNLSSLSFSAKNLRALINDILDFSKLEAGKMKLAENEFDLPSLLFSLKQSHQSQALANGTRLKLEFDDSIPARIATDQLKLSQILHNLVSNAVKFTPKGRVEISVKLNSRDEELLWLDFDVKDTGIGIDEDKVDHIFDKFAQAESSTVRHYGGTGLGLTITKLLLDLMGSEIEVESKPGKGSRFFFSLPVRVAENQTAGEELPEVGEDLGEMSNMRLLLVEDVEINREIVIQFLYSWWKIKPDEAVNGKEAVELASNNNYDLILMDIRMPEMDGYEATRQIKKLPGYADVPILALTADKNQEVLQARKATQFNDLLTKPFEPKDLRQIIVQHLAASGKNFTEIQEPGDQTYGPADTVESGKPDNVRETQKDEPSFEISRYEKMAGGNGEVLEKWIASSVKAFETYKEEFAVAAKERNEANLSALVHQNTSSVYYVQANRLAKLIQEYRELLKDPAVDGKKLREKEATVLPEFDKIISGLKDLQEERF